MKHLPVVSFLNLVLAMTSASTAHARLKIVIPAELQQSGLACLGEALRLCPNALSAKDHGVACVVEKRRLLSRPCQAVYEQGLQLLNGHDVHLTLHRPKAP